MGIAFFELWFFQGRGRGMFANTSSGIILLNYWKLTGQKFSKWEKKKKKSDSSSVMRDIFHERLSNENLFAGLIHISGLIYMEKFQFN